MAYHFLDFIHTRSLRHSIPRNVGFLITLLLLAVMTGCREDETVVPTEYDAIPAASDASVRGFYLLNEGNMGSNKCTLDYGDFLTGLYARNFYAERNPNVIKELGDVGNDIGIYGSRLYVVVNCSNKVEVLDAASGVRIGQIDIPNCRYVRFHNGSAYVSSYVGTVLDDPSTPQGAVYRVDTLSLAVTGKVSVGYQPEEMVIDDDIMYVANSGGYRPPEYDNTVSVVSLIDFRQTALIPVGINLHRIRRDSEGKLWVTSRGNYRDIPSRLFVMQKNPDDGVMTVTDTIPVACSELAIHGDRLYYFATEWSELSGANSITYGIIDTRSKEVISNNFITDGTEREITMPYGLAIHPDTGDILLTDAKNYVSSGTLYCFSPDGKKKWSVRTGDIPSAITFLPR